MFQRKFKSTSRFQNCIAAVLIITFLGLGCGVVIAMRFGGGAEPVKDGPWPDGALAVANLKSRFSYSTGDGGDSEFLYRGNTATFQQALDAFGKIRAPKLNLFLHDGPFSHWAAKGKEDKDGFIDWAFTLFDPEEWHSIYNNPHTLFVFGENQPVPAPRFDVYVGALPTPGGIDWTLVKVPETVTVKDERALGLKAQKPAGQDLFYGVIYNTANGKTIAGAEVEAQQYDQNVWKAISKVSADGFGAYRMSKLPAGQYRIVASAKGFASRSIYHQVIEADSSTKLDGELSAAVTIKGQVSDEQDKPLKDVRVTLESPLGIDGRRYDLAKEQEALTDENGQFTFTSIQTGYGQFQCKATGLVQLNTHTIHSLKSWHTPNANRTDFNAAGVVPVDLRMTKPGKVHCKVTSADDTPLDDGLNVTIADAEGGYSQGRMSGNWQRSAAIDRNGVVEFGELPPGRYFVVVGYWVNLIPDTKIVTVTAGQSTEVPLTAKMRKKRAPEEPPKPVQPPRPPTTDDKF